MYFKVWTFMQLKFEPLRLPFSSSPVKLSSFVFILRIWDKEILLDSKNYLIWIIYHIYKLMFSLYFICINGLDTYKLKICNIKMMFSLYFLFKYIFLGLCCLPFSLSLRISLFILVFDLAFTVSCLKNSVFSL